MGRDEQFITQLRLQNHPKYRGPIAGADDGDGGDDGTNSGSGDSGSGDDETEGKTKEEQLLAENRRLKREKAEREKDQRKAERQKEQEKEKEKERQGQYETLAQERQTRIEELEAEVASLQASIVEGDQRRNLESLADEHGFKRPKRVWAILQDELGDEFDTVVAEETLLKRELTKLARSEPELVDQQRRSGAPGTGSRRGNGKPDAKAEHNALVAGLLGGGTVQ